MIRSSPQPLLLPFLALVLLTIVLEACGTAGSLASPVITPTQLRVVTAVAPMGPPAPTKSPAATISTAPTPQRAVAPTFPVGPVAWTLTILHTGEVYGDVLPCG